MSPGKLWIFVLEWTDGPFRLPIGFTACRWPLVMATRVFLIRLLQHPAMVVVPGNGRMETLPEIRGLLLDRAGITTGIMIIYLMMDMEIIARVQAERGHFVLD
jgi:hypothetical protein